MKVYLCKDVEKVGLTGEIIKVSDGYAKNFLLPRKLAVKITGNNESFYQTRVRKVEDRKEVIASKTSMLAQRIGSMKITLKRKMHDDGKLYGAINAGEIVEALAQHGISVSKSQILFDKSIKSKGEFGVTIKLTTRLQPKIKVNIIAE